MQLNAQMKISDVNKIFQSSYPYLKLEFFQQQHEPLKGSLGSDAYAHDTNLSELSDRLPSSIDISADRQVMDIEKEFQEKLGMHVQVFRQSNLVWIETSKTDTWSLAKQNDLGRELHPSNRVDKPLDERLEDSRMDGE